MKLSYFLTQLYELAVDEYNETLPAHIQAVTRQQADKEHREFLDSIVEHQHAIALGEEEDDDLPDYYIGTLDDALELGAYWRRQKNGEPLEFSNAFDDAVADLPKPYFNATYDNKH